MTTVVPEVDHDIDLSIFEKSEFEIVCDIYSLRSEDWGYPNCPGDPANWIAWKPGCCSASPRYRLVCNDCKRVYQNWIAKQASIFCPACKTDTGGFVSFTPLKKGA